MEINENLKALRKGAGLTQSEFAEKTGVHFQTVSKWERGASVPDVGMLGIISEVLGVTLEKLLGQEEYIEKVRVEWLNKASKEHPYALFS